MITLTPQHEDSHRPAPRRLSRDVYRRGHPFEFVEQLGASEVDSMSFMPDMLRLPRPALTKSSEVTTSRLAELRHPHRAPQRLPLSEQIAVRFSLPSPTIRICGTYAFPSRHSNVTLQLPSR